MTSRNITYTPHKRGWRVRGRHVESMTSRNITYTLDELLMIDPETISLIISGTVPALVTSSGTVEMSREAADTMFSLINTTQ